jgi:ATP-dependent RNA helicase RhlE
MSFLSLGLSEPLLRAIKKQGYQTPFPIQTQAIPAVLAGKDVLAAAQTGTGKTAGFTLPILQLLDSKKSAAKRKIKALVLTPTRELAAQIDDSITTYGSFLTLESTVVYGGVNIKPQIKRLKKGVDILTATPGRLLDLQGRGELDLSHIEILVLDEADRMLDMGFIHDIRKILKLLPKHRQNLLFSATFSSDIREMVKGLLRSPVRIDVCVRNSAAEKVEQLVHPVDKPLKTKLLSHLIREKNWSQVLVFTRTKSGANRLRNKLERDGIIAAAIHGNKSQNARTRALTDFKQQKICALVATDIAARGLDIEHLPYVVNFELPDVVEDYVHRIGRTGRAGAVGQAVSLVSGEEKKLLVQIERLVKQSIPKETISGFEPDPNRILTPDPKPKFHPRKRRSHRPDHKR